jgi:hypothetical protein
MTRTGPSFGDRLWRSMLRPVCFFVLPGLLAAGCRSRSDLVEAELRTRDAELRQTRTDLQRAEGLNFALQQELHCRPGSTPAPFLCESPSRPIAAMSGMIKEISLARGTGGLDEDGWPGDEALLVVLAPKDIDGSAVKVPGNLVVLASEITPEGVKLPLSNWEVPSLQLQKLWRSGWLSSGYHVKLQWKRYPATEKLRITCHFTTLPDGRLFEADKDVTVHLMPGAGHLQPLPPGMAPPAVEDPAIMPPVSAQKPAPDGQPVRLLEPAGKPPE